jgi:hypothetical protein
MKPVLILAACLATAALPALAAPVQPPKPAASAVDPKHCTWEWKTGAGIGVWTERCALDTGLWQLKFRDDLPGFALTIDGEDAGAVIHVFTKPADKDISAILPELRKRGFIPDDNECVFQTAGDYAGKPRGTQSFLEIVPTGKRKAAYDATPNDEIPDPPCGDYGTDPDGIRFFLADSAHPDRIVYLNLGQDGTMFDATTVTLE